MSLFSATFGQLSASIEKEAKVVDPNTQARIAEAHARGRVTLSTKAQTRYAEVFATPATAPEGSVVLGIGSMACLVQLYRYEKRGLVARLPEKKASGQGASAILWQWKQQIGKADQQNAKDQTSHG